MQGYFFFFFLSLYLTNYEYVQIYKLDEENDSPRYLHFFQLKAICECASEKYQISLHNYGVA